MHAVAIPTADEAEAVVFDVKRPLRTLWYGAGERAPNCAGFEFSFAEWPALSADRQRMGTKCFRAASLPRKKLGTSIDGLYSQGSSGNLI